MRQEDLEKTKEELTEEIKKNNQKIIENDEKTRMANVNKFEYKTLETIGFSLLPYIGLIFLSKSLLNNETMISLIGTIPAESVPLFAAGGSLCIGTIGRKLIEWKYKTKERLNAFTKANTESEKLEEEVKYAIELEKAKNRNKAIEQTMSSLHTNQSILNSLSTRYDIHDKNAPETKEESQNHIEKLSGLLKEKYDELDVLTTQKVLYEKFWNVKAKGQKGIEMILCSIMGGAFSMFLTNMPLLALKDTLANSFILPGIAPILVPLIAGTSVVGGYMVKRHKDQLKAFNNLNSELGENALSEKIKEPYKEQQEIDAKIEDKLREISAVNSQLQEQKRTLELFTNNEEQEERELEPLISKDGKIVGSEIEYTQEDSPVFKDKDKFTDTKLEEKKHSLVFRRKKSNSNDDK